MDALISLRTGVWAFDFTVILIRSVLLQKEFYIMRKRIRRRVNAYTALRVADAVIDTRRWYLD
jgi:hypothetical protein